MKKWLSIIIICLVCVTSFTYVGANAQDANEHSGFSIVLNGEMTDYTSLIYNDTHYIPMRKVFEKMGSVVFYRNRDRQILALTRDGDMIRHIIGENNVSVNGEQKNLYLSSVLINDETYIPVDMLSSTLMPDGILYDNKQLSIQKYFFNSDYHKLVNDVLELCELGNFYPEKFQRYINYHSRKPTCNIHDVIIDVNLGFDYPFYENVTTVENPNELLVLVNKYNKLPAGFSRTNLVNMAKKYTVNDGKQYLLLDTAYEKYMQMSDDAQRQGLSMKVVSAYRTEDYQSGLYYSRARSRGTANADKYTARPGFSEHQTGLAVDINSTEVVFEYSAEFKWLQKHAHEYGFILRYPKGKEWITGYSYEPWHYRYVGTKAAKQIYEEGITYEEYYAKYVSVNEFRLH